MSRRRLKGRDRKEWLFKRDIEILCPMNPSHRLGTVFQDTYRTTVHARALLDDEGGMAGSPRGDLRRDGERLRASCARCGGRGDFIVTMNLVLAVFDRMANYGPESRAIRLDADEFRSVIASQPLSPDDHLTSTTTVMEHDDADRGRLADIEGDPLDHLIRKRELRRSGEAHDEPFDPAEI